MENFETAPFDRSGTSPLAIRDQREVSRWRAASTARQSAASVSGTSGDVTTFKSSLLPGRAR
jgi:hypothetical protein